jgi:hypothetical protein
MLQHSFVLDALETTAADTFLHFEVLIEEHRNLERENMLGVSFQQVGGSVGASDHRRAASNVPQQQSRLKQLVPTIGSFHTSLPLREAFEIYNEKHRLVCIELLLRLSSNLRIKKLLTLRPSASL